MDERSIVIDPGVIQLLMQSHDLLWGTGWVIGLRYDVPRLLPEVSHPSPSTHGSNPLFRNRGLQQYDFRANGFPECS